MYQLIGTLTAANLSINAFDGDGNKADTAFGNAGGFGHGLQMRMFGSRHEGGCQMLLSDGSVHFFSENMDTTIYQQLGVRGDGLPTGGFGT